MFTRRHAIFQAFLPDDQAVSVYTMTWRQKKLLNTENEEDRSGINCIPI